MEVMGTVLPVTYTTEIGKFAEGDGGFEPAGDVTEPSVPRGEFADLHDEKIAQVVNMEEVADLLALPAVADVAERTLEIVGHDPERDDALVHFAKLPGSGDDAATVDGGFETVGGTVFLDEEFSG